MPKYLIHGNYVGDGVKGLIADGGTKRRDAIRKLCRSVGGKLDAIYYALGEDDVYCIIDAPDNVTVAAASLAANASGMVTVKTTALLTVDEMDKAAKKVPQYRPPGG